MMQPSEPARLTHIAVRTRDVDASVGFYTRYAGLHVVHERQDGGVRVVWLSHSKSEPDFAVVLLQMSHEPMPEPAAPDHLGFAVASRAEVDRVGELARGEGRLKLGPLDAGPIVGYIVLVRDPSGVTCEFSHGQTL
jgi:catechol 2,3-dioxygenase-like lactoylglutathione lyase family enzyme